MSRWALIAVFLGASAARADEPPPAPEERLFHLRVHLLSDGAGVELRRSTADSTVCLSPCGTVLALRPGDEFRLVGQGLAPSDDFTFIPRDGEVTLRVHPRPEGPRTTAKGILIGGVALAIASSIVLDVGQAKSNVDCANSGVCNQWNPFLTAGGIGALGAITLIIAGAIALTSNPPTTWETAR